MGNSEALVIVFTVARVVVLSAAVCDGRLVDYPRGGCGCACTRRSELARACASEAGGRGKKGISEL